MEIELNEKWFALYRRWLYQGPLFKQHRRRIREEKEILPPGFEFKGSEQGKDLPTNIDYPIKEDLLLSDLRAHLVDEFTQAPVSHSIETGFIDGDGNRGFGPWGA